MNNTRRLEKTIATLSFCVAVALAAVSMSIREDHDITANVLLAIAQFLTLTCTLLGIDYKFNSWNKKTASVGGSN